LLRAACPKIGVPTRLQQLIPKQSRLVPDKSKSTLLKKLQLGCLHLCIGNWQKRNNKFEVEYGSHCGKFLCYLIFKTDQEKFEIIIGKSQSWSWQQ